MIVEYPLSGEEAIAVQLTVMDVSVMLEITTPVGLLGVVCTRIPLVLGSDRTLHPFSFSDYTLARIISPGR